MKIDSISQVIAERRKSLGVSQVQLAKLASVSSHTLSDIESGSGNPTIESLARITDVLGMDLMLVVRGRLQD